MELTDRENILVQEAFMTGRIYTANGERETPVMIQQKLKQNLEKALKMHLPKDNSIPMQLPVEPACKWILVNGRLPEVDKRVLVYVEDYHIDKDGTDTDRILFGYLRSSGKIKPDRCFGDFNVTKWMPIPKP